jgi:hypothetical protein
MKHKVTKTQRREDKAHLLSLCLCDFAFHLPLKEGGVE